MRAVPESLSSRFCLTPAAAAVAMAFAPFAAHAATITVTLTADTGVGSLRDALTQANAGCLTDPAPTIAFAIPGTGPFTIAPASALPTLQCGLGPFSPTIDASTQSGWVANSSATGFNGAFGVVLDGAGLAPPGGCGLHYNDPSFYGGSLTIRGLDVKNFTYAGTGQALCNTLQVYGTRVMSSSFGIAVGGNSPSTIGTGAVADRNVIANNVNAGITVSYGGTVSIENNLVGTPDGTSMPTTVQTVGITYPGAPSGVLIKDNVISGNVTGLSLSNDNGSIVSRNMIGTDAAGTAALPNTTGVSGNTFTGTSITLNTISGNTGVGMSLQGVNGAMITNNIIGLNLFGNAALPNGGGGIVVTCGTSPTLQDNTVSANGGAGVTLAGVDTANFNTNLVGVATNGTTPMANNGNGVHLTSGPCAQYGSGGLFTSNKIANNTSNGMLLDSPFGVGNEITQSSIYANGIKNININNTAGPLPNDPGDPDTGPNNQQNYPVISLVTQGAGTTTVNYSFDSTPATGFTIEFFTNPAAGTPAGKQFVSSQTITTPAAGAFSGSAVLGALYDFISATATDNVTGDTSEFSLIVAVTATPAVTIVPATLNFGSVATGTSSPSQTSTLTSSGTANYQINTFDTAATCYGAPLCYGGPFVCSTNCATSPTTYAPGASCTITASFAPIALGPQSTTIYICDNTSASPNTITLSGTGVTPPPLIVTPSSQDFGNVPTGTTSGPVIFNFANAAPTPTPISPPTTSGPFQVASTSCGATLQASSSCNVNVVFKPVANGPASGNVCINAVCASLSGTGVTAPAMTLPPPVDLGSAILGVSNTQVVTLTNSGNAPLTFSSITVTPPFTLTNNCPTTLAPGASCDLVIGVDSSQPGTFDGTLTIVSNGGSGTVPLKAIVQPIPAALLKVAPLTVGFGDRIAGSTSPAQQIAISNEGGLAAAITGLNVSPDFIVTSNTCGATLAPGSTCFANVAMRAVGFGKRVGQLVIGSNAQNAPLTVNLAGTGCRPFNATGVRVGPRSNCTP